jgi:hypothetical protein
MCNTLVLSNVIRYCTNHVRIKLSFTKGIPNGPTIPNENQDFPFTFHVIMLDAKLARESTWEDIIYIWAGNLLTFEFLICVLIKKFKGCKRPTRNEFLSYIWCNVTFLSMLVIYIEYYSGACKKTKRIMRTRPIWHHNLLNSYINIQVKFI